MIYDIYGWVIEIIFLCVVPFVILALVQVALDKYRASKYLKDIEAARKENSVRMWLR